ncbi:TPA: hypothetical protein L3894_002473, partial [Pseudomonas aeruginosa]|nr:hypothetical protein [Pseudomonas aeruginosa]
LQKIPQKVLEQAKQVAGVQVNSEQNELIVTEALAGEAVTALKEALVASNSTAQASALEGHNQAILALEKCPVCSGRAPLVFQSPLGFKANCLDKKCATRYLRLEQTGRVFEQSIPESTGFTVVGRRAFTIRQMAGA